MSKMREKYKQACEIAVGSLHFLIFWRKYILRMLKVCGLLHKKYCWLQCCLAPIWAAIGSIYVMLLWQLSIWWNQRTSGRVLTNCKCCLSDRKIMMFQER